MSSPLGKEFSLGKRIQRLRKGRGKKEIKRGRKEETKVKRKKKGRKNRKKIEKKIIEKGGRK